MFGEPVTEFDVVPPLQMERMGGLVRLSVDPFGPIYAKITRKKDHWNDADGTDRVAYGWRKQQPAAGGTWADSDDKVKGFDSDSYPFWPAFYGSSKATIAVGEVVRLWPGVGDKDASADAGHGLEWRVERLGVQTVGVPNPAKLGIGQSPLSTVSPVTSLRFMDAIYVSDNVADDGEVEIDLRLASAGLSGIISDGTGEVTNGAPTPGRQFLGGGWKYMQLIGLGWRMSSIGGATLTSQGVTGVGFPLFSPTGGLGSSVTTLGSSMVPGAFHTRQIDTSAAAGAATDFTNYFGDNSFGELELRTNFGLTGIPGHTSLYYGGSPVGLAGIGGNRAEGVGTYGMCVGIGGFGAGGNPGHFGADARYDGVDDVVNGMSFCKGLYVGGGSGMATLHAVLTNSLGILATDPNRAYVGAEMWTKYGTATWVVQRTGSH